MHPDPKRAQKSLEQGDKAVAAERLDEALAAYEEAARYAPLDAEIVERAAALRSKRVRSLVEAAERDALAGLLAEATEALRGALQIDPGNTIVQERLVQLKAMQDEPSAKPKPGISGLPRLKPQPGKRNLNLRGDTKSVYEQLASLFGIKAIFDPDLTVRNVHLRVDDVDFATAMTLLGAQSGTLWRPVNPTLMFVAPDTLEKRREYAMQAEQTFPIAGAVGPEDVTEMLRILRDITGGTRIDLDTRSRTITMRDTPERLALAGELIQQLQRARGEVMLEIEILEVDRNKARALGITPPASAQLIGLNTNDLNKLKSSTTLTNLLTNIQQVFAAKGFSGIPAVVPIGGGLSTFLLTLPSATVNFSDTLSLVQSGRQVLLRAQDGKPASFFVGDRFPITLSLLSGSVGNNVAAAGLPGSTIFPQNSFNVSAHPSALVANNFTGDTLPDLAVVFDDPNSRTFVILRNQDNGNFVQATPSPITLGANETGQVSIGTGVFRNDSAKFSTAQPPDVVLVNSISNNVSVLLGSVDSTSKANGLFTEAPGSPFPVGTVAMVSANFLNRFNSTSNAAEVDLAVVNQGTKNVAILLSSVDQNLNVTLTEATGSPIPVGTTPVAIATGDLNADGVADLAVVNQGDNTVTLLLGSTNQDGTFTQATGSPLPTSASPAGIVIANFANGTVPDIAVTNNGVGTLGVYLGLGKATFARASNSTLPLAPRHLSLPR